MPLDPIVSLAVAVAEAPGSCALLLGSGVSVDAGIPTGWQVYLDGVGRMYRLQNETTDTPDDDELLAWLEEAGHGNLGYSGLLDLITPDQAVRREYLAGHFANAQPGQSHELVADLVADGALKVVITTNFDRLLEQALAARGIEPVVVSDDGSLAAAPRREHVDCFVLKAHGDYLQETIRNTPGELADLEPGITGELQTIFDHYAVFVLGYSGSDEAIARALRARRSRYGLWWLSLTDPVPEPARGLVEAAGGRVIVRAGAAEALRDLFGRLAVYRAHPSGHTPGSVHDEALTLLRRGDEIGLEEAFRRERHDYASAVRDWTDEYRQGVGTNERFAAGGLELIAIFERRLAGVLPCVLYAPDRLAAEMHDLVSVIERQPVAGGMTAALGAAEFGAWFITYVAGAVAVRSDRWDRLPALLRSYRNRYGTETPVVRYPGDTGNTVAMAHFANQNLLSPAWEYVKERLEAAEWLVGRYPETFQGEGQPGDSLSAFDFVAFVVLAASGSDAVAHWTMEQAAASRTALTIHRSPEATTQLAKLADVPPEELGTRVRAAFHVPQGGYPRVHLVGNFPRWAPAVNLLEFGQEEMPATT